MKRRIITNSNPTMISRAALNAYFNGIRSGFDGTRDYWETFGYPDNLSFSFFWDLYKRGDLAKTIVNAYPDATWRDTPNIYTKGKKGEDNDPLKKAWEDMVKSHKLYQYFNRTDKLSNIGRYGVLVIGFDDTKKLEDFRKPVTKKANRKVTFLLPRKEDSADIVEWNKDSKDPRFGKPELYRIKSSSLPEVGANNIVVHHSRLIHSAERLLEDDVYGEPMLEGVYNRFIDLIKIVGGSAEMFWQGADRAISFEMDPEAQSTPAQETEMSEAITDFMHGIRRYLKLQGVNANVLEANVFPPTEHFMTVLKMISAASRIPLRILIGSESGEGSSEQDDGTWKTRVDERRMDHANPNILIPFIDRCMEYGALPKEDYVIEWPDIFAPSRKDKFNNARIISEAIANYARAPQAKYVLPIKLFLREVIGLSADIIKEAEILREEEAKELIDLIEMERESNLPDFDMDNTELDVEDRTNPVSEVARDRTGNV